MADGGGLRWEDDSFYDEEQVEQILRSLGLDVEIETESNFNCYCPFHGNRDTPSFTVSKNSGVFFCFNPSCGKTGDLMYLIKSVGKMTDFQAKRLIARSKLNKINVVNKLEQFLESKEEWARFVPVDKRGVSDPEYLDRIKTDMWRFAEPQIYMRRRGFEKQILKDFEVGYDLNMDMVCVPMHDPTGKIEVGAVRRSLEGKVFKNTPGLPTSKTLFNLHRAKRTGDAVVIVEASFSVMRLAQVGYPNAVGLLMGHFSKEHAAQINKYFSTVVIMTDFDKKQFYTDCRKCAKKGSPLCKGHNPGEELGMKIAETMSNKRVMWAHHGGVNRFPDGAKDPDDMDDETIRYSIKNAVSHLEYALDL